MSIEVGVLESYQPDDSIKELYNIATKLREDTTAEILAISGEDDIPKSMKKLNEDPELMQKWTEYLQGTYGPKLNDLLTQVSEKNKVICPGYADYLNSMNG